MEGLVDELSARPRQKLSGDQALSIILTTIAILVLGVITIHYQCKQISKQIREIRVQRAQRAEQWPSSIELRKTQMEIKKRHKASYNAMSGELKQMKSLQRDVKSQLSGLQVLVDRAQKAKEGGKTVSEEGRKKDS